MSASVAHPSAASLPHGFALRAPWPDELPRLRGLLHIARLPGNVHPRVLLHEEPERIVGGFLLVEPKEAGQPGALLLRVRPAHHNSAAHEALFEAAKALARELGLPALSARLSPEAPARAFLIAHGAKHVKTDCFYEADLAPVWRRLAPMARRFGPAAARYAVRMARPEDQAALAEIAAEDALLEEGRAASGLRGDHSADHSLVCMEGEVVVGALLAKATGQGRVYVETRMVHPSHATRSGLIHLRLLSFACERWLAAGFTKLGLSFDPAKDREAANFTRRRDFRLTSEQHTLRWEV